MNIPSANCVVRFDTTQSQVRSYGSHVPMFRNQVAVTPIQIASPQGRVYFPRDNDAKIELQEGDEKPVLVLSGPECKRSEQVAVPFSNIHPIMNENLGERLRRTQTALEINGKTFLEGNTDLNNCMAKLRGFCEKTKTPLESTFKQENDECCVFMKYQSVLRSYTANGRGPTRTRATTDAALQLVVALRYQVLSEYANI